MDQVFKMLSTWAMPRFPQLLLWIRYLRAGS
jgi:hypothetical protein